LGERLCEIKQAAPCRHIEDADGSGNGGAFLRAMNTASRSSMSSGS
jgi:hypothetical protein